MKIDALKFFYLFFTTVMLLSCKKKSPSPVNYNGVFSVTINDSTENFNASNSALLSGPNFLQIQAAQVAGKNANGTTFNYFLIGINTTNTGQTVTTGTYTDSISPATGASVLQISYENTNTGLSYDFPIGTAVVITSISSTQVQGSFSGVLAIDGSIGAASVNVNGTFNLKISP